MATFETAGSTHVGMVRSNNEDSYLICRKGVTLAAVADGIGGHANGEVASDMCCKLLEKKFMNSNIDDSWASEDAARQFYNWIEEVNKEIYARNLSEKNPDPMGTTLCGAMFFSDFVIIANVGDSRFYALNKKKLVKLTTDHTVYHNGLPYLARAMGVSPKARPAVSILRDNDTAKFIIMSDGIYNSMKEKKIAELLVKAETAEAAAENMSDKANEDGGVDNLTAVVVFRKEK